ncbi:hypothetical protein ANTQUA_LOCUS7028 [Anthophora quadrimaculata]
MVDDGMVHQEMCRCIRCTFSPAAAAVHSRAVAGCRLRGIERRRGIPHLECTSSSNAPRPAPPRGRSLFPFATRTQTAVAPLRGWPTSAHA